MNKLRCVLFMAVFCALPAAAPGQQAPSAAVQQTVAKIVSRPMIWVFLSAVMVMTKIPQSALVPAANMAPGPRLESE